MEFITSGRLWLGIILGALGYHLWMQYQAKKNG